MMASKRYGKAAALVPPEATYPLERAVSVLKEMPATKFNETV